MGFIPYFSEAPRHDVTLIEARCSTSPGGINCDKIVTMLLLPNNQNLSTRKGLLIIVSSNF